MFEYGTVPIAGLSKADQADVLAALESLSGSGTREALELVVHQGQVAVRAKQFVGLFQLGPLRLQVLPKMYRTSAVGQEAQRQAAQNLLVMLRYALDLPIHVGSATALDTSSDWLETLTRLFTEGLLAEWQRGPVRRYESVEDDLTTIRGRLRVSDHIRRVGRQHILPVEYDEFMADTGLNRLFRFVVERLLGWSRNEQNIRNLRLLAAWMTEDGVALPQTVDVPRMLALRLDRLHTRYEFPLLLAQLFIRDEGLLASHGIHGGPSLFFDMNALFEAFLTGVLLHYRDQILPAALQGTHIAPQGAGSSRPLLIRESTGKGALQMKPDVLLKRGNEFPLILDFKYKMLQSSQTRAGVSREDLYQMFTYAQRYRCPEVVLLYPAVPNLDTSSLRYRVPENGGSPAILRVSTVELHHDFIRQDVGSVIRDLRQAFTGGKA